MSEAELRFKNAVGSSGRTLIVRLQPGADLVRGIIQACQENGIRNGYIASCIGSLKRARFTYGVPDPAAKSGSGASPIVEFGPITEFIGGQGSICHNEKGETLIHFHGLLCDKGHIFGGHFDQPGNIVCTTMEIVIQEVLSVEMTRPFDADVDQNHLEPRRA